jgi:dTDP-4-dehydrorhamnose 3,5-epimerase-like enzyme
MKSQGAQFPVKTFRDRRGTLRVFEEGASLPFALQRCFVFSDVPSGAKRGGHEAPCEYFLTALAGGCRLVIRDHGRQSSIRLGKRQGVLIPEGVWLSIDRFSEDAIVLVCASRVYKDVRFPGSIERTQ